MVFIKGRSSRGAKSGDQARKSASLVLLVGRPRLLVGRPCVCMQQRERAACRGRLVGQPVSLVGRPWSRSGGHQNAAALLCLRWKQEKKEEREGEDGRAAGASGRATT